MVDRQHAKASDGSMTAQSTSPRAISPLPFSREKLKKGYASFRAAGPPWNSSLIPWMSFRAAPHFFPSQGHDSVCRRSRIEDRERRNRRKN